MNIGNIHLSSRRHGSLIWIDITKYTIAAMHGFIFSELKKYINQKFNSNTWLQTMQDSGLGTKNYWPAYTYHDEEMFALIDSASKITETKKEDFLRTFGIYLAPGLMNMYKNLINPDWKTLDLIEHTESRMHTAVRAKNMEAKPPQLNIKRVSNTEVKIGYHSSRKLCGLLKGIAFGVAEQYGESIDIQELQCMHNGDTKCTLFIELMV